MFFFFYKCNVLRDARAAITLKDEFGILISALQDAVGVGCG